ncbi:MULTISPECIES: class A beta-lactamase [unclassified Bradyrhizobium]|uniref:class A beta-lactamase n=1 Tax=unclassified Bradyrhizobium TaxID=2631580 RepID=UPI00247A7A82|nr:MULTISPECIES: class A beta-lactamase [unclassified Bradyrhizobium]WGR68152.1 class A beta-lactamase [Bradyrhizobium sp. ISRA426]WGR80207.1 class A beta-lactamase [Bradyrhizobium sp. ISRA430]WGR83392.1 class A beta-lactamase [Bradyrhizobium sp. ISRA432]
MLTRRQFGSSALAFAGSAFLPKISSAAPAGTARLIEAITELELKSGGRLGVSVLDTKTGALIHHKGDERFPMCSTFKVLASAAILKGAGGRLDRLERRVRVEQADIVENSPVSREHVGGEGMSLLEVCDAAITRSDNTAGNLLLKNIGGTTGLTSFARSLGDKVTRLDRIEPALNEAAPGDPRDTTTPNAMAANFRRLLLGNVLLPEARDQLAKWLIANKTGDSRLRAGLPQGWRVGDKTGAGEHGTTNDVAIVWPPEHPPLIIAVYLTGSALDPNGRNDIIASVGREIGKTLG